jgi:hypothetical protein
LTITDDGRYEVVAGATPELYELLGRLISLALINMDVFPITFVKPFNKQLIGVEVGEDDLAGVDAEIYRSLKHNSIETLEYETYGVGDNNKTTFIK